MGSAFAQLEIKNQFYCFAPKEIDNFAYMHFNLGDKKQKFKGFQP